jgi:hypothetical protein
MMLYHLHYTGRIFLLNKIFTSLFSLFPLFEGVLFATLEHTYTEETLKPIFFIEPSIKSMYGHIGDFYVNENLDMLFSDTNLEGHNEIFYSNVELGSEFINVTEIINTNLLNLGYIPKSYSVKKDSKPWDSNYHLNYGVQYGFYSNMGVDLNKRVDDDGSILFRFTHEGNKRTHLGQIKWLMSLGVWNHKYGFKLLNVDLLEDIDEVVIRKDHIFIKGFTENTNQQKIAVIPIPNGYWGEIKKTQPVERELEPIRPEEPMQISEQIGFIEQEIAVEVSEADVVTTEKPISWWDKIKSIWWP